MFLDPALGAMSKRDGGKLNGDDFYESIYFVLCVINVNSELKAALSPMGIGDAALTPTFIELQGYILRGITLHCYGSR